MASHPTDRTDGHERRIQDILARARRQTGIRDLLLFAVARVWTAVLGVAAAFYAFFTHRREHDEEPRS